MRPTVAATGPISTRENGEGVTDGSDEVLETTEESFFGGSVALEKEARKITSAKRKVTIHCFGNVLKQEDR
jgi:hypothetical protein